MIYIELQRQTNTSKVQIATQQSVVQQPRKIIPLALILFALQYNTIPQNKDNLNGLAAYSLIRILIFVWICLFTQVGLNRHGMAGIRFYIKWEIRLKRGHITLY